MLPLLTLLLLSGYAGATSDSCPETYPGMCMSNAKHKLKELHAETADACCAACQGEPQCAAFTFFGQQRCNLFKSAVQPFKGDCTCGIARGPAPPKPPPPPPKPTPGPACKDCPNIVLLLTDDQDLILGGWNPNGGVMSKTQQKIADAGMFMSHWYIHTPICAPSRSELLSGRYFHTIKNNATTPPARLLGSGAVGHVDLQDKVYPHAFPQRLRQEKGYTTGLFGKCMNGGCGSNGYAGTANFHTMGAFDVWFEGTSYQNGDFYDNSAPGCEWPWDGKECSTKTNESTVGAGYLTSELGNRSIAWIEEVSKGDRPFFIYFAPHAPHSPATPAAWYKDACSNVTSPRTPDFNYSGVDVYGKCTAGVESHGSDFHELVSCQPGFDDKDVQQIDALARKRCQTLLSVDDSYAAIYDKVEELGLLKNTYFVITSDHGYNLGQHRIPSNKFLTYEHSSRIPMVFTGPGIKPGSVSDIHGTNVDLAPTILGMAGLDRSPTMDGRSVLPQLVNDRTSLPNPVAYHLQRTAVPDRDSTFLEYYNQGPWEVGTRHPLDDWSNTYIAVYVRNSTLGGPFKYAEYDPYGKQSNFSSVMMYELFDLSSDPYELKNIYNSSSAELKQELHHKLRTWYNCSGASCP